MCLLEYVEGAVINNGCCQAQLKFAVISLKSSGSVQQKMLHQGFAYFSLPHLKHSTFSIIVAEPTQML